MQRTDFNEISNEFNIPESWKWENQTQVNDKKERKGKKNRKFKKKNQQNDSKSQQSAV